MPRSSEVLVRGGRSAAWRSHVGEEIHAPPSSRRSIPGSPSSSSSNGTSCPRTSCATSSVEDAQRRGEDQLRPDRLPTSRPCPSSTRPRRRLVELASLDRVPGAGVRGGAAGRAGRRAFADGVIPTVYDTTLAPEGTHIVSLFTQWVPHEWARGAAQRRAGGVRRSRDRRLRRARPRLHGVGAAPPGHRAVRDGAGVRAARRQHLPRRALGRAAVPHAAGAGLRRLPHADPRAVPVLVATHAGGGVTGIPAYNCVREIRRDRRRSGAGTAVPTRSRT